MFFPFYFYFIVGYRTNIMLFRHPLPLEQPKYKGDLGVNSKERAVQKDRERNVLAMLILDPSNIPESPSGSHIHSHICGLSKPDP